MGNPWFITSDCKQSHKSNIPSGGPGMCFVLQLILGKICQLAFDASTDAAPPPPTIIM